MNGGFVPKKSPALRIASSSILGMMEPIQTKMKHFKKLSYVVATAAFALVFSSCSMPTKGARTAFSFDPSVKKPTGAVKVHISTGAQRVYVTQGDEVLLATPCSVGTSASPTPKGEFRIQGKTRHRRRASSPGAGYPMTYWMSFYSPAYGMHWGFVKPYPCTHGCVRLPLNSARKIFDMVKVGTPISVATSKPWDSTIGAKLPVLDDSALPNPPNSYLMSPQVFSDAEKGKMWNF
ncbi:MAG: hypothetical protein RLZZ505_1774 [Verrucomicrobiota bacterium]|jgi:hypothetical protein